MEQELEIEKLLEQLPCNDKNPGVQGVLLSDQIECFATDPEFKLISPFNPERLKPAGYELTIGEDYYIEGEFKKLEDKPGKNKIEIPPFEVVIISTREIINLPRFLIARWNLRVIWAYQGLLWLGALQVDPGWVGPLYCPIYNLSSKIVTLDFRAPIALMDFVTTTTFNEKYLFSWDDVAGKEKVQFIEFLKYKFGIDWEKTAKIEKIEDDKTIRVSLKKKYLLLIRDDLRKEVNIKIDDGRTAKLSAKFENDTLKIFDEISKKYERPPKRKSIRYYTENLESALFTKAGKRLDKIECDFNKFKTNVNSDINNSSTKLENKVNEFEKKLDTYIFIIFTSIAVLIAALSIIATTNPKDTQSILSPSIWLIFSVIFSILAFIYASSAHFARRHIESIDINEKIKQMERAIWLIAILTLVLAIAVALIIWRKIYG
jgi:deoxycytidine triphosphate deaminase